MAAVERVPTWNEPNVTEQQLVLENPIAHPGDAGGTRAVSLQRAGYLNRLRLYSQLRLSQSAATTAPGRSAWGPLASVIRRLRVEANARVPLYSLSGLGALVYTEISNRDGSLLAPPAYETVQNVSAAASLHAYTTPGTGAQTYNVNAPFELQFSVPMFVRGIAQQFGLWLLQDQAIDLRVEAEFAPPYATSATPRTPYSGGAGVVMTTTMADSKIDIERELFAVPARRESRPDETFAHQVIEEERPIAGRYVRYDFPSSGIVLRTVMVFLDANDALIEYTDIDVVSVSYGSMVTPIRRTGWSFIQEFLQDYGRYPLRGVIVHDWYKAGLDTVRLAKNAEVLANFRIEATMKTTTTGRCLFIVDSLVPTARYQAQ